MLKIIVPSLTFLPSHPLHMILFHSCNTNQTADLPMLPFAYHGTFCHPFPLISHLSNNLPPSAHTSWIKFLESIQNSSVVEALLIDSKFSRPFNIWCYFYAFFIILQSRYSNHKMSVFLTNLGVSEYIWPFLLLMRIDEKSVLLENWCQFTE